MVEFDGESQLESVVWIEPRPLVAVLDLDALFHADEAFRRVLLLDSSRLQQEHERSGTAVENRNLGRIDVDEQVVDTQPGQRRHQVLDGRNLDVALGQSRTQARVDNCLRVGNQIDRRIEIDAAKDDAGIRRGRTQYEVHLDPAMQSDASGANQRFERALLEHVLVFR